MVAAKFISRPQSNKHAVFSDHKKTWHLLKIAVKPFRAQSTASKSHSIFAVQAGARHARLSLQALPMCMQTITFFTVLR